MKLLKMLKGITYSCVVGIFLSACSGDGIDGTGSVPGETVKINGTAAVGAPIANASITVKGSAGGKTSGTTASDGSFTINVSSLKAPYLLKLQQNSGSDLYSIAAKPGTINIHPFTDLIARNWFQVRGYFIATEFQGSQAARILPTEVEINAIEVTIKKIIRLALQEFSLTESYGLLTGSFLANSLGFDALLDRIKVQLRYNRITVSLLNSDAKFEINSKFIDNIPLNTDFTIADTIAPSVPTGLLSIAADSTSVLVVWNSSKDNIGVAGYDVYRDGQKIATTVYPQYSDTGLTQITTYKYSIEAFDGAGNRSGKTAVKIVKTLTIPDSTPPNKVVGLTVIKQGSTAVKLTWPTSPGALAYDIYTGSKGNVNKVIATSVATSYLDLNPINFPAETCYVVRAFDAARNDSVVSNEVCALSAVDQIGPTTIANPVGGTYSRAQSVRLFCDDGLLNSGCAATYYTVNGDLPTTASTLYSGPINISSTTTLKFISVDNANNVEKQLNTQQYIINNGTVLLPGLEFSSTTYQVSETGATALITVRRNGDSTQAVSVEYTTRINTGSATVDFDYTAVTGVLSWSAGDATVKTFLLPIKGDNVTEPAETVVLSLLKPVNAALASNIDATVTIQDAVCNGVLDTDITQDTVITDSCTIVTKAINIRNAGLTISPGVTLIFQENGLGSPGLNVDSGSYLKADGTSSKPILFTVDPAKSQYWSGIQFTNSTNLNNILNNVTVEYAGISRNGTANVHLFGSSSASISNSTLRKSKVFGFQVHNQASITRFLNNNITANASYPVQIADNNVGKLDGSSSYTGNAAGFDKVYVLSTTQDKISTNQTWDALDVPYSIGNMIIGSSTATAGNTTLTITPGAVLKFRKDTRLEVSPNGTLIAKGTVLKPILFTADSTNPLTGHWVGLYFNSTNNNILDYVIVEYGGFNRLGTANIKIWNTKTTLSLSNSISRFSSGYGLEAGQNVSARFPVFSNNEFTQNDMQPLRLPLRSVDIINSSIKLTGNAAGMDEIYIDTNANSNNLSAPLTWPKAEVPYSIHRLILNTAVTIEAGVDIVVRGNSGLIGTINVRNGGSLNAVGTAALPISIKGDIAAATPGFWKGIFFFQSNSVLNNLQYVNISDAGDIANANLGIGNIIVGLSSQATIENCIIADSASNGIAVKTKLTTQPSVLKGDQTTNTFTNINTAGNYVNIFNF